MNIMPAYLNGLEEYEIKYLIYLKDKEKKKKHWTTNHYGIFDNATEAYV